MSDRTQANFLSQSSFQDVSKSIDQLIGQLSISNVAVPRFDKYTEVFEFLNEFETVTATLTDEQQLKVLVKAFPPGRLRSWYDREVKPLVLNNARWSAVKSKIINYYSNQEDRDRYFAKLQDMKFDQKGKQKLFIFVEDLLYTFAKAFRVEDDDLKIRYVKSVLPPEVTQSLSHYLEFNTPSNMSQFMKSIRQYDVARIHKQGDSSDGNQVKTNELIKIIRDLVKEESTNQAKIIAAMQPSNRAVSPTRNFRAPSPRLTRFNMPRHCDLESNAKIRGQTSSRYDRRSVSPTDRNLNEKQNHDQPNYSQLYRNQNSDSTNRAYHAKEYTRPSSPYPYRRGRSPSPNLANDPKDSLQRSRDNQLYPKLDNTTPGSSIQAENAFSSRAYYDMFGKPARPCSGCGSMHWDRHCLLNLK